MTREDMQKLVEIELKAKLRGFIGAPVSDEVRKLFAEVALETLTSVLAIPTPRVELVGWNEEEGEISFFIYPHG